MAATLMGIALFLVDEGPGRSDNPSDVGGVLIVVGIALLLALAVAAALLAALRLFRRRREADRSGRTVETSLPSEEGRPWSSER